MHRKIPSVPDTVGDFANDRKYLQEIFRNDTFANFNHRLFLYLALHATGLRDYASVFDILRGVTYCLFEDDRLWLFALQYSPMACIDRTVHTELTCSITPESVIQVNCSYAGQL